MSPSSAILLRSSPGGSFFSIPINLVNPEAFSPIRSKATWGTVANAALAVSISTGRPSSISCLACSEILPPN